MNPLLKMLETLGMLGLNLTEVIQTIDKKLDEVYHFEKPIKLPFGPTIMFRTIRNETIGARSFLLEKGILRGWFYRIRERRNPFVIWCYVWERFENEEDAIKQWEGFVTLLKARELVQAELAGGK